MAESLPKLTPRNLGDLYRLAAIHYSGMPAFATRAAASGNWLPLSFAELYEKGRALAVALIEFGLRPQENIAIFSDNRVEWVVADCAVQLCGAINVPRGTDVSDHEMAFILNHCEARFCFVENTQLLTRLRKICEMWQLKLQFILLEDFVSSAEIPSLETLISRGLMLLSSDSSFSERLDRCMDSLKESDGFTLIYTSGTTGEPKGVLLTHGNMLGQIKNIPIPLHWRDRILSILPIWHVYERVLEMITIARGACTYYSSVRHFADDLLSVEPTFMASAPRLWERLHTRILQRVSKAHPLRQGLFHLAFFFSHHYHASLLWLGGHSLRETPPRRMFDCFRTALELLRWLIFLPLHGFFNAAVLERIRLSVGGCLRGTISGGGALPTVIDKFFNSLGIPVLEGYGLTETSPVLAVRRLDYRVQTTVGPIIPETELRIIDVETGFTLYPDPGREDFGRMRKGEIQVRGPQVIKAYYKNPQATEAAFIDGWFRTGDLGLITWNDCLRIVGRCKETIVLSSGENLEPGPIEMRLRQSPLIEQCMVVGQDQKQLGALIVPSEYAKTNAPNITVLKKQVTTEIRRLISVQNGFKPHECIRTVAILENSFTAGTELTALFKLRRHVIDEKYREVIAGMFRSH
jgi:long-chain acyl-CoA synthetase